MSIKVEFDVKFGKNKIEIPINQGKPIYLDSGSGLSKLKDKTFTIINRIPTSASNAQIIGWKKHTLHNCDMQDGIFDKSSQAMIYRANTWTAWLDKWDKYKAPNWLDGGYYSLADDEKDNYFTANVSDLLIFGDIPDLAPTNEKEFQTLVTKYKNMGGQLTSSEAYINYRPNGTPWKTNHIEIIKG